MTNALVFIVATLIDLYVIAFVLRFILQWRRADFRNPLSQFIVAVTSPLVIPLRRFIPSVAGLDTSSLVVAFLLKGIEYGAMTALLCTTPAGPLDLLLITVFSLIRTGLNLYFFLILVSVILSWVAQGYNPMAAIINQLVEPVLAPLRRFIPPIGGFDISPIFAIIGIQALTMLIPKAQLFIGLGCSSGIMYL